MPHDAPQLGRRVVARSPCRRAAPSTHDVDRVAGVEGAARRDDPDRQQRRAALAQRPRGAGVDDDAALRRLGVAQPELERGLARRLRRRSACPPPRPPTRAPSSARLEPAADHGRDPGRGGHLGRDDLRAHPAGAQRRRRRGRSPAPRARRSRRPSSTSRRAAGRRAGRPCTARRCRSAGRSSDGADEDRDLRGEEVVVAERDLVGRRRVVLVDDRHDAPSSSLRSVWRALR